MIATRTTTKRVAVYVRQSVTRTDGPEFSSLDAQEEACRAYITAQVHNGWVATREVFRDAGFSGGTLDRPGFRALMTAIKSGRIDVVVVYKVDRLSRSLLDFAQLMKVFEEQGVAFVSVTQNFSTADALGKLTLNLLMSFSEFEREMVSERTKDKIQAARRRGHWTGGPVPFGYDNIDKKLVVNKAQAGTLRVLVDVYLSMRSARATAKALNDAGHRRRKGKRWTKAAVLSRLKDPLLRGLIRAGDEMVEAEHEAIIDSATAAQVDQLLAQHTRPAERVSRNAEFLLAGLVTCVSCDGAYTPSSARSRGKRYRYYRCVTRDKVGTHACQARPLPAEAVEDFVVEQVRGIASQPEMLESVVTDLHDRIARERASLRTEQAALPTTIGQHREATQRLVDALDGVSGPGRAAVEERLNTAAQAQQQAEARLVEVEERLLLLDGAKADAEWVAQALGRFTDLWEVMTPENRQRLLNALVKGVRVDSGTGELAIELHDLGEPMAEAAR
jgi:DNA invertase Pin-like site-specific DNA recombinase